MTRPGGDGGDALQVGRPAAFGVLLRSHRERCWLSRRRLAERCGLSVRTIFNLEQGRVRSPRGDSVRLLADALELRGEERARFEDAARTVVAPAQADPAAGTEPDVDRAGRLRPRQLPAAVRDFTGRTSETMVLRAHLTADGAAPVVVTLAGKPGVGKTALAVHVAHRLAAEFPDGQLYVNLRGTGRSPLAPESVLDRFLRALGVQGGAVPEGLDERAALYRARLADRRMLVVLDDAAGEAQVRPLLPGAPGSAVLVTSRMRMAGLEGAIPLDLDVLPDVEAVGLLARIAGQDRVAGEDGAAGLLIERCGALPLAVRVVGARLATRPQWSLRRMADLLADERHRLDQLTAGDLEVRAGLALSYQGLSDLHRRAFRLLGVLDVGTFAGWLAAPLLDIPVEQAERLVDDLADASLLDLAGVDATGSDRYRFHDVVRVYARERALADEPGDELQRAVGRVAAGWLTLAELADLRLPDTSGAITVGAAPRWPAPPELADRLLADPLAWFDTELSNLIAAVETTAAADADEAAWELANQLNTFCWIRSHTRSLRGAQTAALAACRRAGNRRGQAAMLALLGFMAIPIRQRLQYGDSQQTLLRALDLFHELDDQRGQAKVHLILAEQLWYVGQRYRPAAALTGSLSHAQQALRLAGSLRDRMLELESHVAIGAISRQLGLSADAEAALNEALPLALALGANRAQAVAFWHLSEMRRQTGQPDQAAALAEQSLAIVRRIGDPHGEATLLLTLADIHIDEDRPDQAATLLTAAQTTATRMDFPGVQAQVLHTLGRLRFHQRRFAEAADLVTAAAEAWADLDVPLNQAASLALLADALHAAGQTAEAHLARQRALDLDSELTRSRQ